VNLNVNSSTSTPSDSKPTDSSTSAGPTVTAIGSERVPCPNCAADIAAGETSTEWQICTYCEKRLLIRVWPIIRQNNKAAMALSDQATCFFHPDKVFQACCRRCGRFVCALCDLQLGADHVCPTCFERGRSDSRAEPGNAEWRYRDVLYDSIAVTIGWGWILFWPTIVAAIPAIIFLHVKYRKAPRSYLIPRFGWRFWVAYAGLAWLPLLIAGSILIPRMGRH
jgi:hypothetical protein